MERFAQLGADIVKLWEQCGSDYLALQTLQEEEGRLEQTLEEKMERWEYLSDLAQRIAAQ